MSVVQRIAYFGASTMIGFGQGFQPVCGFNYGAKLYSRVREGFWFCVKVSCVFLVGISVLGYIFAPWLVSLFRDDPAVIDCGLKALRYQCLSIWVQSFIVMSTMLQQSIGKTAAATFLSVARQGVFFIPLVWILSWALGLTGIQMTQAVSDILTFLCAIPIQLRVLRSIPTQDHV